MTSLSTLPEELLPVSVTFNFMFIISPFAFSEPKSILFLESISHHSPKEILHHNINDKGYNKTYTFFER